MLPDVHCLIARLEALEHDHSRMQAETAALNSQIIRERRRLRVIASAGLVVVVASLLVAPANRSAIAQGGKGIAQRVEELESAVAAIQAKDRTQDSQISSLQSSEAAQNAKIAALQSSGSAQDAAIAALQASDKNQNTRLAQLENDVLGLQTKTQFISIGRDYGSDHLDMYIRGTNLHIENGAGNVANGLGNVVVGYNNFAGDESTLFTGSHNIVYGWGCSYSGQYGLVGGSFNRIEGNGSVVLTGDENTAHSNGSVVVSGISNIAAWEDCVVVNGDQNHAEGVRSCISGGHNNLAQGELSWIGGGSHNTAKGKASAIGGGGYLTVTDDAGWAAGN